MATSTRHNLCEIPINFIDQNLHQVRQISDTYVNERLSQASKVNQNWCTSYNKKFNVGWIISANSIFFFQYLATKTNAKKTLVEFPKNQRISTPEHVKIFQRNKDLYAIVIYPTVIQIAKILSSKDEKELIEIINFPVEGEKIIALSDSWEESSAIFLSVLTNKNSVYLIELEPRIVESKINLNISLQILHRKPVSLLQKLKSYIAPLNDLEDSQVFCCMETSDRPGASVRTYNIFSYVEGRLEFWTITLKSHDDKYVLFSQNHRWAIDLRILLDHEFSQKLFEKYRKLADFEVLDFKPTLVRNQGQVVLIKLLARVNEINHQCFEGHFSFATVTLDDVNGAILKFDENVLHDGFRVSREELHDKDQVFYGRIVSILENDDVHTCCHFSLRPKKGVYEESNNNGNLQNLTHTNLYTAIESNVVYSVAIEGKILGAGHYFSYEENAEDVLFITTENSLIRMKVLKYLTPTALPGQIQSAQPSNTRDQPIISFDDLEEFSSRLVIALHTRNQIALKFKDMLNNAKDNLLGVKEELDELLKTRKLEEIKEGIVIYTNELLNDKTRNMVLLSTFTPSNQAKINQWSSESLDILIFELKKKVNVLYSWIEFLKKFHIWDIDSSIKEHAYSNLEKLIGAIKLCEEQTRLERLESDSRIKEERKALLSQAVEACMNTWRLTPSLDANIVNTNVFYTQIDKFEDFLIHLIQYHQDYVNDNLSYDHMHFLADLIVITFHELHKLRDMQEYENLFLWTQEENLLDHLFKVIQLFEKVLLSNAWNVSERQEDLARISYILIREYNNLYKRHPNEEKWKRELNRVYETLFRHQLFERAGDFAEEFVHMDILARLYYECNYDHHIKDLFVKWADKKFLEEFVHNYIQNLKENKLDNIPRRFILFTDFPEFYQEIMEILLREYPQVGWLLKLKEGNLTRADQLIEQTSLKESILRNRIAATSAGRFIHNQGAYEKVLRVDHLQEGNISQEKIVDPETLIENILSKENEEPVKVIEDCVKILSSIRGNEYYQNISNEQYKTMLNNVIGKALEFDDDKIQKVDKLLNVPQGAQSNQIYNIIRETTLYRVIKDLLEIAKTEGTDLQTIVGNTNNNDPVTAKFIQKLISLN